MDKEDPKGDQESATKLEVDEELSNMLETIGDPLPQDGENKKDKEEEKKIISVPNLIEEVETSPVEEEKLQADDELAEDIKEVIKRFKDVADDIVVNFKEDREEIEDTINELRQLFTGTTKPKGFIVEGLVSALRTKADTNANAIKVLDTFAKLIAATKNLNIVQGSTLNVDLSEILKRDISDDEDED